MCCEGVVYPWLTPVLRPGLGMWTGSILLLAAVTLSAPAQERLLGLDVSAWQGNISQVTWNNIRTNENRRFVILRSSRGGTTGYYNQSDSDNSDGLNTLSQRYDDPYFVQNINRVTAAGMFAGSYHFSRPDIIATTTNSGGIPNSGTDEADHFLQMAGAWMRPGYLVPVHDLEAGDGIRTDEEMAQFSLDFSDRIYEVMGFRPAIYLSGNYAAFVLGGASASSRAQLAQPASQPLSYASPAYPILWSARYPNQADPDSINVQTGEANDSYPALYGPWDDYGITHPWVFWQYASTGRLPSFNSGNSNLDFDVVRGGLEFLKDQLVPALWTHDGDGAWTVLTNWNSGRAPIAPVTGPGQVPPVGTQTLPTPRLPGAAGSGVTAGANDTVLLDRPNASVTVSLTSGTYNIRKLYQRETLNLSGGSLTINYVPAADSTPHSARFSGPVSLSGGSLSAHTIQVDAAQTFTLGGGTLTLNTLNLLPGPTPGHISVTNNVALNPLANAAARIGSTGAAGAAGRIDLMGAARSLTIGNGLADVDLAIEVVVTNGGLTKAGSGTLELTQPNTYAGTTTVSAGRLLINNSAGSGTGPGAVTVSGGFLGGTGSISGVVTLGSAGTIAPGTTPNLGTLTLGSAPILDGTNSLRIDRNGGTPRSDRLTLASGTLNYGGALVISNAGVALAGGEVFSVFSAPGYSGAFAAAHLPSLAGGLNWYLGSLTTDGTLRVNHAPVAAPDVYVAAPGVVLQIPFASLLTNDFDPDGDLLTVAAVAPTSTNGISLSTNATHISYLNPNPGTDLFSYTVADGRGGSVTGLVQITISVPDAPPGISQPPLSQTVIAGQDAVFTVTATGSAPLAYQWRFNDLNLPGATSNPLVIAGAQPPQQGNYSVIVTNGLGAVTSSVATLTVNYSLTTSIVGGGAVSPAPAPSGYAPGSIVPLTATPFAGAMFMGWSGDASGSANPLNVVLTTNKTIIATFLNTNVDLFLDNTNSEVAYVGSWQTGTSATDKYLTDYRFASTAAGGTITATYRPFLPSAGLYDVAIWYPQGSNRATNAPWTISDASGSTNVFVDQTLNGGGWRILAASRPFASGTNGFVRLSNDTGASGKVVMADGVRFTFVSPLPVPPAIDTVPLSQVVKVGSNVVFSVAASGFPAPAYQWYFNSNLIAGATASAYVRSNAQLVHAGNYSVLVSNLAGAAATDATLAVLPLAPLWLESISALPDGRMALVVTGEPGYPFTLERTTNFTTWQAITNGLASPTGVAEVIDPTATNRPAGFYRARQ